MVLAIVFTGQLWTAPASYAVDGISVTGHWSGTNENLYGGYGQIWRHDIQSSAVTNHILLYDNGSNPARNPVLSPDGTRVAFLLQDGSIVFMSTSGGAVTDLPAASSHGEACLDWPQGDWIYYTKGGFNQQSGSKLLHRVNAATGADEYVVTFKKDDGVSDCGTWRFHIAGDLQHAVVRPDDDPPEPYGRITAYDLVNDNGLLALSRSTARYRCSTGIDPVGTYFMNGHQDHEGVDILLWSDLSSAGSIRWVDAQAWGPDTSDTGLSHNRNAWSTNSQQWLCIHVGWGTRGARGANQMLINWVDHERLVVTENTDNSYAFDCAGDFWVSSSSPTAPSITAHPQPVTVNPGHTAAFSVTATGTPPLSFQWQRDGGDIGGATASTYSLVAAPADDGALFRCVVSNAAGSDTSNAALLTVVADTTPPTISAATAAGDPNVVSVLFSEPVDQVSAETAANYSIDNSVTVSGATLNADTTTVTLATSTLQEGPTYTLTVNNVTDRADPPNAIAANTTATFTYSSVVPNAAPQVSAGADASVRVNTDLLLDGTVADDGLPSGTLTITWSQVSGPGTATFADATRASTYVTCDVPGEYLLQLSATDGDLTSSDDLLVTVTPSPSITILSPAGGEVWEAGTTQYLEWTAEDVSDVRIDYSVDGGETWQLVEFTLDTASPHWGRYPWVVPNDPSTEAVIQLEEYSLVTATRSLPFTIVGAGQTIDLTAPAAGATLTGGEEARIQWTAEEVSRVVVEHTLDAGERWEPIATVDAGDAAWGDYPWTVPQVVSPFAEVRVRTPSGGAEDRSGLFTIEAGSASAGSVALTSVTLSAQIPHAAGSLDQVTVGGGTFPVAADGSFEATVAIPAGVESAVFALEATDGETSYQRLVRIDLTEAAAAIPGLQVSAAELREFLGGRGGVMVWVDAGGGIQVLDFRSDDPVPEQLVSGPDCVNPLLSPDGTRVVYSQGLPNGPKLIRLHDLDSGSSEQVGLGDIGFFHFDAGEEAVVYCDWSAKELNGSGGNTYRQRLAAGEVTLDGTAQVLHDRAMDAGPNRTLTWLGQVYDSLWAFDVVAGVEYPTEKFFLLDGTPADHQTCNGSMAPDGSGRLMTLVIPHDFIRIFSYEGTSDTFQETSRFTLPAGLAEWEFPEWSTDPAYFTAVLRGSDRQNRLFIVKVADGELVPERLEVIRDNLGSTPYGHLYVEP